MVQIWVEKNRIEREKGKESPIPNPSKNAAPETYLGMPMPDPTSLESEKGTRGSLAPTLGLTGSGSRIRASQCDSSSWSPHRPPHSLARSGGDGDRGENKWARVLRGNDRSTVLFSREQRLTVDLRWTAHIVLGSFRTRWALALPV
jgi:hypothetical protein